MMGVGMEYTETVTPQELEFLFNKGLDILKEEAKAQSSIARSIK